MDLDRLYAILDDATVQLRKGEIVTIKAATEERPLNEITIDAMPHVEAGKGLEIIDLELLSVGVNKAKAEQHQAELLDILSDYPEPERLAGGPSYIEVGAELGDQGKAFQLFALGKVLGLWNVITPAGMGFSGDMARTAAGQGFVMITGWRPGQEAAA